MPKKIITHPVADVDAMMAALGSPSPEVAAVMEKHGVLPPMSVYVDAQSDSRLPVR